MYIKQTVLKSRIRFALLLRWSQISVITLKPQSAVYEEENINVSQNLDESDGQTEISAISVAKYLTHQCYILSVSPFYN